MMISIEEVFETFVVSFHRISQDPLEGSHLRHQMPVPSSKNDYLEKEKQNKNAENDFGGNKIEAYFTIKSYFNLNNCHEYHIMNEMYSFLLNI